jgi:hypothetical protein
MLEWRCLSAVFCSTRTVRRSGEFDSWRHGRLGRPGRNYANAIHMRPAAITNSALLTGGRSYPIVLSLGNRPAGRVLVTSERWSQGRAGRRPRGIIDESSIRLCCKAPRISVAAV